MTWDNPLPMPARPEHHAHYPTPCPCDDGLVEDEGWQPEFAGQTRVEGYPGDGYVVCGRCDGDRWYWRREDGPAELNPQDDPTALRYELDSCRAEIERLRDLLRTAGIIVAAVDVSDGDYFDRMVVGKLAAKVISDDLRAATGFPVVEGERMAELLVRIERGGS